MTWVINATPKTAFAKLLKKNWESGREQDTKQHVRHYSGHFSENITAIRVWRKIRTD